MGKYEKVELDLDVDALKRETLRVLKKNARAKIAEWAKTPRGRAVQEAGRRFFAARNEGRPITTEEIVDYFDNLPKIMNGDG